MARFLFVGVGHQERALTGLITYSPIGEAGSWKNSLRKTKTKEQLIGSSKKTNLLNAFHSRKINHLPAAFRGNKADAAGPTAGMQDEDETGHTIPILSLFEIIEKMQENNRRKSKQSYGAMYSSIIGGITVDPTLMVIPLDDHMVHRGHGVFDTALIIDGHLYELDSHLDRLLRSALMAKIAPPFDRSYLRSILIQTVAASQCKQGSLRYWLTAGPGDFFLSSSGCPNSAFYAVVIENALSFHTEGVKVVTSSVPMKPPQFATMKNVNYLPNVLSKMEAEEKGAYAAIWFDDEGFVAEGPNMNVAFINKDKELLMPSFEKILSGCTAKRMLDLASTLVEQGVISDIRIGNITAEEGKAAEEMMLIGSGVQVTPVIMWDEQPIGNGKCGPITHTLLNMLLEDMKAGPSCIRVAVPY
ncbi:hypothetical protein SUGI_0579840 [Cryptomeria japonica]|uniref:D-amino-acid transaminase, chloroplastic isoform X2 n=1 Tax=Cryptomeria japonica TaxID=3369 RepID=UPI002414CB05|nr:D-amino-acid transaminase, chloroplastic isoform X2 [Cryptomeria japonica]GLJ29410.1 hypothetical protein SUGI_0579840 [Cryptomeria japonica]